MLNIYTRATFIRLLPLVFFVAGGCKKNDPVPGAPGSNPGTGSANNAPGPFAISLAASSWDSAKITWTKSVDPDNDPVEYKLYLNNLLQAEHVTDLAYTFRNLTELTSYSVKVVASDPKLKETTSTLNFTTVKYWLKFLHKLEYGAITGYSSQKTGQMVKANDGGYIIVGDSQLGDWPYGTINMFTMKIDSLGNKIWQQRYNYSAGNTDNVRIATCNNGYVICGDYDLMKIDNNGNLVWHRDYLLSGVMTGIGVSPDGYVYATGLAYINAANTVGATLDKYDQFGNTIWRKTFSRTTREEFHDIKIYSDNEIIVAGQTGEPDTDFWVLKMNSGGDILWEKTYHDQGTAFMKNIIKTREGNYVFTGFSLGTYVIPYFYLQMIDGSGNNIWTYTTNDNTTKAYSVTETNDNSLVVAGGYQQTYSSQSSLYKFDKSGNKIWEKLYPEFATYLFNKTVIPTGDGGYLINAQKAKAYNTFPETDQIYLFKTDDKGEFN